MSAPTTTIQQLVASGWPVFPLRAGTKVPAIPSAHPAGDPRRGMCRGECGDVGHGVWDATTSVTTIQGWTRTYPQANWGVHAGAGGLLIVDLDVRAGKPGAATWGEHEAREGAVPTFTVRTPSGGWHLYYALPGDLVVTTRSLLGPGVDVRSTGGYVVLPGAWVDDGEVQGFYTVERALPVAPLPAWIERLYRDDQQARTALVPRTAGPAADAEAVWARLRDLRDEIAEAVPGTRNDTAARVAFMAGQYAGAGQVEADAVVDILMSGVDGDGRHVNGMHRTIRGQVEAGMRDPRPWAESVTADIVPWYPGMDFYDAEVAERVPPPTDFGTEPRPVLDITESGAALDRLKAELGAGRLGGVFRRGGEIVHTPRIGAGGYVPPRDHVADSGPAQVRRLDGQHLGALVDATYQVVAVTAKGNALRKHFPRDWAERLIGAAHADLCPNVRPLTGVTHTPLVRPDSSILDAPGWDEGTGLLYLPTADVIDVKVPDVVDEAAIAAARSTVLFPISDFPFVTTNDRANWIGSALTPLLRLMVGPPYQLLLIEAPNPGAGKSYLFSILRAVHGAAMQPSLPHTDEEWGKAVAAALTSTTAPIIGFDNVRENIRSAYLEGLLTATEVVHRVLGRNDTTSSLVNDRLWVITANNATYGGDLARRILRTTIDPGVPDPQKRIFGLNPVAWVREHKAAYLSALLTLVRAWVQADKPMPHPDRSDDYARWVSIVRGVLGVAGIEGTFSDTTTRAEQSSDDEEWHDFLVALEDVFGLGRPFTVREIMDRIEGLYSTTPPDGYIPRDHLPGSLSQKIGTARGDRTLGTWITHRRGRWVTGLKIEFVDKPTQGPSKCRNRYMLVRASEPVSDMPE